MLHGAGGPGGRWSAKGGRWSILLAQGGRGRAAYKASGYSKRFYEEHRDVLTLRKAAKQAFDEYREKHGEDVPIPRVKDLNAEYAEILARKKKNYTEYRREKSQMQEYLMAQKIVETMLHDDRNRQADQQREEQEKSKKQR